MNIAAIFTLWMSQSFAELFYCNSSECSVERKKQGKFRVIFSQAILHPRMVEPKFNQERKITEDEHDDDDGKRKNKNYTNTFLKIRYI